MVSQSSIASRGRGRRSNLSRGHVVSVDLDSVDVGDHSELVLELHIDGSHVVHTREGFAEVLGS